MTPVVLISGVERTATFSDVVQIQFQTSTGIHKQFEIVIESVKLIPSWVVHG